ncbi:MAG TPA: hypothetical protein GXX15_06645 [Clostridia bacterium]|nr:hypothetical protein [Clostridia bacterium]
MRNSDGNLDMGNKMREFFSERELGKKEPKSEEISVSVYNGIVTIFEKYKINFSKSFPIYCDDYDNVVCGFDDYLFYHNLKAMIPNMHTPIRPINSEHELPDKYAILDFIEFCFLNFYDVEELGFHSFYGHYHYNFTKSNKQKERFREEINRLFERNGIVFYLDKDGMIKRILPTGMDYLISNLKVRTHDDILNELIGIALTKIKEPKREDRIMALEKIWDAFERLKTFYTDDKKESVTELIKKVAGKTPKFDVLLEEEFKTLTRIGNEYQIRHFERDKIQIESLQQIDYLFYRMLTLINLCLSTINL